ncbi:hypothetical protein P4284_22865 [Bacillus swezeyi]|uniref:hypothetical protein n=1 Tax=Bacillus swezeyi TaxID=1925020 RepID=UPI002E1E0E23|nr:hypothetical protein [Bacillus swezeyi]
MFKQRLIGALAYLIAFVILAGLASVSFFISYQVFSALLTIPVIDISVKVGITFAVVFVVAALIIQPIVRLQNAYLEHKRVQKDVEEETR